ncbi:hypothetical protein [Paraburkholderia lycopersici]|uniref:Uncharacterized protein n=1 Tax=Paraburkholderia lycopersici TaxID=416944 RepID=A0A1G7DG05_9BURK|nr:hypothetical protein [Paraburkholderia lycopersici]SDE50447.1 hypothetical protein SAMN05421548_1599 [Paraburkholderia lycopersici]
MKKLFYFFLLAYACSSKLAMGQAENLADINIEDVRYQFLCEGGEGTSRITVEKTDLGNAGKLIIFEKNLEQTDDCGLGTWTVDPSSSRSKGIRLVTINPGQPGVSAQMLVFSIDSGNVFFAGYIPVAADRVGNLKFELETNDTGNVGIWREIYEVVDNKIKMTEEQLLVDDGDVCIDGNGEAWRLSVGGSERCDGKRISGTLKKAHKIQ